MGVRSVRLGPADERRLERIQRKTGWTASEVLKHGMRLLDQMLSRKPASSAYETYASLDLGPGGYALGRSDQVRETVRGTMSKRRKT